MMSEMRHRPLEVSPLCQQGMCGLCSGKYQNPRCEHFCHAGEVVKRVSEESFSIRVGRRLWAGRARSIQVSVAHPSSFGGIGTWGAHGAGALR